MKKTVSEMRERLTPLYGKRETEAMIREIFRWLKGWNSTDYVIHLADDYQLSDYIRGKINEVLARLERYEPLQYITGSAPFYGLDIKVGPGVLIPRPETAGLVDMIVDENPEEDLRVADVCTGSGCIACALGRNLRFAKIVAIDSSDAAVEMARENVAALRLTNVKVEKADVFAWQPEPASLDIIVSNPPYIDRSEAKEMEPNVLGYEPDEALFVPDSDPLRFYRRIAEVGCRGLVRGGRIYFEINPRHASGLAGMMRREGYADVEVLPDMNGMQRYLKALRGDGEQW